MEEEGNSASPPRSKADDAKIETIQYDNGDVYEGEVKDGKRNGKGVCRYANGGVYDGDWKADKMHGHGTFTHAEGGFYKGEWENDNPHGKGVIDADGRIYDGEVKEGKMHGWGKVTYPSGSAYEGEWRKGKEHGKGEMTWPSGNVYEGQWVEGEYHGWGTLTYASGKVYEGEFKGSVRHGKGTTTYPSGCICEGCWTDGKRVYSDERKLRSPRSQEQRLQKNVVTKHCEHCGADDYRYKLRVCSGCNLALFCSPACQKAARGSHQRICSILSELPSGNSDRLVLEYDREKMVDLDAGLRYATKYMDNLKHLAIKIEEMASGDAIKLSAKQLSSLLRSKRGALESVFWLQRGSNGRRPEVHGIVEANAVWKELTGLKQLRLDYMRFRDVQHICDIIGHQKNTLMVLSLPYLEIDWPKAKCRRAIAQAVGSCKHLVQLDLIGCLLMDPDLKVLLSDLPNLRILDLKRDAVDRHEFTDKTCGLIARKCPGLQELSLRNHNHLSVRGVRRIFEGCPHLRLFCTSTRKLSCGDLLSLLDTAPQLMYLSLEREHFTRACLDEIIEATGGRTLIQFNDTGFPLHQPLFGNVSAATREKYDHQIELGDEVIRRSNDLDVMNEWEYYLA